MNASRARYGKGRDHSPAASMASASDSRVRRPSFPGSEARWREEERAREEERRRAGGDRRDEDRYRDDEYRRDKERRREDVSRDRRSTSGSHGSSASQHFLAFVHVSDGPCYRTLATAVQTRSEYLKLQEDLHNFERLTKSAQYETLPQEDKKALQQVIQSTAARRLETQQELNRLGGELIPDDFWPFVQRAQQQSDPGYRQMTIVLEGLKGDVHELYGALSSIPASQPPATAAAVASGAAPSSEPMKIASVPTDRPKKRRRLSTDAGVQVPPLNPQDLEGVRDRLAALDHRISDLQNDLLQYDGRVVDEVESQLDYRMAGLRVGLKDEGRKKADPELQKRVETLSFELSRTEAQAIEAEEELKKLEAADQSRDESNGRLQEENDALRKQIDELREGQARMAALIDAQTSEIRALSAAVTAYISRPLAPPPPPAPMSAEAILEALRPKLLTAARDDLLPILDDVRSHVERQLQEQSNVVSGELKAQIAPLERTVEGVRALLERLRGPAHAAGGAAPASATTAHGPSAAEKGKGVAR
ncbi:hypothetical protein BD413DRAFT_499607 [Trametes elegans]|nr:hypothetical protein BD413DRAFT_499607 [Trametes elegans]